METNSLFWVFNIKLRLDLDIRALIIASKMNLESGPRFSEVWFAHSWSKVCFDQDPWFRHLTSSSHDPVTKWVPEILPLWVCEGRHRILFTLWNTNLPRGDLPRVILNLQSFQFLNFCRKFWFLVCCEICPAHRIIGEADAAPQISMI